MHVAHSNIIVPEKRDYLAEIKALIKNQFCGDWIEEENRVSDEDWPALEKQLIEKGIVDYTALVQDVAIGITLGVSFEQQKDIIINYIISLTQ